MIKVRRLKKYPGGNCSQRKAGEADNRSLFLYACCTQLRKNNVYSSFKFGIIALNQFQINFCQCEV